MDIISLLPHDIRVTLKKDVMSDVFFTRQMVQDVRSGIQVVFASHRDLIKESIAILDQGDRGQILNLKQIDWNFLRS
jgi:hypothetical protein